jgi:hypothetical protein
MGIGSLRRHDRDGTREGEGEAQPAPEGYMLIEEHERQMLALQEKHDREIAMLRQQLEDSMAFNVNEIGQAAVDKQRAAAQTAAVDALLEPRVELPENPPLIDNTLPPETPPDPESVRKQDVIAEPEPPTEPTSKKHRPKWP